MMTEKLKRLADRMKKKLIGKLAFIQYIPPLSEPVITLDTTL